MNCSICLENIHNDLHITECKHLFHSKCLLKWEKKTCPLCRRYVEIKQSFTNVFYIIILFQIIFCLLFLKIDSKFLEFYINNYGKFD
jgi:hypothetical protein